MFAELQRPSEAVATVGTSSATGSGAAVFSSASAARVEELQRTLALLYRDVLFPFYEPVERLRVVNNRAIRVQDVVEAIERESLGVVQRKE